jgi:Protein of unknown function (DUF2585)
MTRRSYTPWITLALLLAATAIILKLEGRLWFCDCGQIRVWITDVWTSHCSQHLADPYSITHMSHGLIFCGVFALFRCKWPVAWQFVVSIAIAAAWEILENSAFIINRYRESTMSLDYMGDSVVNSLGDIGSCGLGFILARRLGWKWSFAIFAATELILLALIRDNLTLNVIMLLHPFEFIKQWQNGLTP